MVYHNKQVIMWNRGEGNSLETVRVVPVVWCASVGGVVFDGSGEAGPALQWACRHSALRDRCSCAHNCRQRDGFPHS